MSQYQHGVYLQEIQTEMQTIIESESDLICAIGTSPNPQSILTPQLCYSLEDFKSKFGYEDDFSKWTLSEVAHCQFNLYNMSPIVAINVFDPSRHKINKTHEVQFTGAYLASEGAIVELNEQCNPDVTVETGVEVVAGSDSEDEEESTFYQFTSNEIRIDGTKVIITAPSKIVDNHVIVRYSVPDVSQVTTQDILNGIAKIEEVYPRFNLVPSILIAPKYSIDSDVAAGLKAKTKLLNGHFNSICIVDLPTDRANDYSIAPEVKSSLNMSDPSMIVCWGMCKLNNRKYHLSTQIASLMHLIDSQNGENPSVSPSNHNLQMDSMCLENGTEVFLTAPQGTYLNGQGIVTAIRFGSGWKCWGNRTSIYPGNADPKDCLIPVRRVFSWIGNTLVATFWTRLDSRLSRRFIDAVLNSAQIWMDSLVAGGVLIAGRVSFQESDNPITSLQDGIVKFRVQITPPSPAESITFTMQYDPSALQSLFETE